MDRSILFNNILELAPSEYTSCDYKDHISSLIERYKTALSEYEPDDELSAQYNEVLEQVDQYCSSIINAIDYYYRGLYAQSYCEIKKCLDSLPKWKVAHKFSSFRMRIVDEGTEPTFEGMFHIPYDKRGIISTQRYSAPGLPCLYLGLSPYTCWEEMGKPDLEIAYVSRFQPKDFNMYLPFSLPFLAGWTTGKHADKTFLDNLLYFPFVMVSMVKVSRNSKSFKPEYMIPQMVVQWLLENRTGNDDPSKKPIGVIYTSVHYRRDISPIEWYKYDNIAIPCFFEGEKKYSQSLSKWFSFTDPIRCDYEDEDLQGLKNEDRLLLLGKLLDNEAEFPLKEIR